MSRLWHSMHRSSKLFKCIKNRNILKCFFLIYYCLMWLLIFILETVLFWFICVIFMHNLYFFIKHYLEHLTEKAMATHSSTLAWKIPWTEEPGRTGVAKSRTRLSDFTFTFHFHALEKEMATHSSVLAWRIPGTTRPGGLPSMGSHRVGHDWSDVVVVVEHLRFTTKLQGRYIDFPHALSFHMLCLPHYQYHSSEWYSLTR